MLLLTLFFKILLSSCCLNNCYCTFFYKFASHLGKTLGSSVKRQSSIITVVILPRSEDSEQLLSALKSAIPHALRTTGFSGLICYSSPTLTCIWHFKASFPKITGNL